MLRAEMKCLCCGRKWDEPAYSMLSRFRVKKKEMESCSCGAGLVWGDTIEDGCMEVRDVEGAGFDSDKQVS